MQCIILFNCKEILIVTPDAIWYNPPLQSHPNLCCGVPLRVKVLLRKWSNILVFYCLVFYCIILLFVFVCVIVLCFNYHFCNWSFSKTHWRRLSLIMPFYCCFRIINTLCVFRIETTWRLRENVVSPLFQHGTHLEYLYWPCWILLLHWCLLKILWLFFYAIN